MVFGITLPNDKYGKLMPEEDAFLIKDHVFCVADGITRDPTTPLDFGNLSVEEGLKNYPNPSGAKIAADLFCREFTKHKSAKEGFIEGNNAIRQLNKDSIKEVDYLVNDFYACVAAGGIIEDKKLYWGQICDCGVVVFDRDGHIKFQTNNGMQPFLDYIKGKEERWGDPQRRRLIRSKFRNNPKQIVADKLVSYGALTGENTAEKFMEFGEMELQKGDLVIFYSDGFENLVTKEDFFKAINQDSETLAREKLLKLDEAYSRNDYKNFGHERTLIAVSIKD